MPDSDIVSDEFMRFIPSEARRYVQEKPCYRRDVFDAAVLFIDISGYSAMAERFGGFGEAGVEMLSNSLNGFLSSQVALAFARSCHPPSAACMCMVHAKRTRRHVFRIIAFNWCILCIPFIRCAHV